MEVVIGKENYQYKRDMKAEELFNYINTELSEKNYILNYLLVDGFEIHDNIENYIEENINKIKKIEVIYKTQHEFIINTWEMTIAYFDELIPQLEDLATDYYQNKKKDLWGNIPQLVDIINQLFQSYNTIVNIPSLIEVVDERSEWTKYEDGLRTLSNSLIELEKSMTIKDTIRVADFIMWRLYPIMTELRNNLQGLQKGGI